MSDHRGPRAKKHFGQHFLVNKGVVDRICQEVDRYLKKATHKRVVEIGPGQGALTSELLARKMEVLAIELDVDMCAHLREKFPEEMASGQLKIVEQNALRVEEGELQGCEVICGNLPYNVGSAIVTRALKQWKNLNYFCFMLQKEVVEKFRAERGGDYGPLSVRMKWMTEMEGHFWVKPGSFSPPPKVDSGVFWFKRAALEKIPTNLEARMKVVDELFSKRRKMIRSSKKILAASQWAQMRPEEVSADDFILISDFCLGQE